MVLAPHTDDGEFGCGGTIARLIEEGTDVFYTAFSACEESVPAPHPPDVLRREMRDAMSVFGIPDDRVVLHDYHVRQFPAVRQDILQDIVDIRNDVQPDLVFLPCEADLHQDHQTVTQEGIRAYKDRTVIGYELPWNNLRLNASAFFALEERHVEKKIEALACYKSQSSRNYSDPAFIESLARTRGVQAGVAYAEVFETVRWMI